MLRVAAHRRHRRLEVVEHRERGEIAADHDEVDTAERLADPSTHGRPVAEVVVSVGDEPDAHPRIIAPRPFAHSGPVRYLQ